MSFAFHPEAEDEFKYAIAYYENCDAGLGLDFAREVFVTIQNKKVGAAAKPPSPLPAV